MAIHEKEAYFLEIPSKKTFNIIQIVKLSSYFHFFCFIIIVGLYFDSSFKLNWLTIYQCYCLIIANRWSNNAINNESISWYHFNPKSFRLRPSNLLLLLQFIDAFAVKFWIFILNIFEYSWFFANFRSFLDF